jgi:pimeloyl-ACP methyl ester carboxylesterase
MHIMAQGAQTYVTDRGTGTPTLFLHGVPDSAEMWTPITDRLPQVRAIAVDLPGLTTRSQAPAGFDFTLPSMAKWVNDLLAALNIDEPINLVFGDFGGLYALAFAVTYPDKVRRLALAGGVGFSPDYRWHSAARMWRTPILGELTLLTLREGMFKNVMKSAAPLLSPEHWHEVFALSMGDAGVRRNIMRQYRAIDTREYAVWEPKLHELTRRVPMLVLWGDTDPFIDKAFAEKFGAQTVIHYLNYGHWIAVEAPEEVAAKLESFLL